MGFCRETEELVLDVQILNIPYLRDDMDVYSYNGRYWNLWTSETQVYSPADADNVPDLVKLAMVMLE